MEMRGDRKGREGSDVDFLSKSSSAFQDESNLNIICGFNPLHL